MRFFNYGKKWGKFRKALYLAALVARPILKQTMKQPELHEPPRRKNRAERRDNLPSGYQPWRHTGRIICSG